MLPIAALLLAVSSCGAPPAPARGPEDDDADDVPAGVDCDDYNPWVGAPTEWHPDADQDGFGASYGGVSSCGALSGRVADASDCDDTDAAVGPPATWYADADGDGWGDGAAAMLACDPPASHASQSGDCDDTDAAVGRGVGTFRDTDGDGFGDAIVEMWSCDGSGGGVSDASDCDDTLATVFPGAPERCGDGVLNGCGAPGPCRYAAEVNLVDFAVRLEGAVELGQLGDRVHGVGALTGGGPEVYTNASTWDDAAGAWIPQALVIPADASAGIAAERAAVMLVGAYEVIGAGDVDGDGQDDALVPRSAGDAAVLVVAGPLSPGVVDVSELEGTSYRFTEHSPQLLATAHLDASVALVVTTWRDPHSGDVFVFDDPLGVDRSQGDADALLSGADNDGAAASLAVGDLTGDGADEIVVGAPGGILAASRRGVVYVVADPSGASALPDAFATLRGGDEDNGAGTSVDLAPDVDGDGADDLLVGAGPGTSSLVAAWLWAGPLMAGDHDPSEAICRFDLYGNPTVAGLGDIDGDGFGDVAIGDSVMQTSDGQRSGVYVVYGPLEGVIDLALEAPRLVGEERLSITGSAVDGPGDLDGDGLGDLLVGAPWLGTMGDLPDRGAIYIVSGQAL